MLGLPPLDEIQFAQFEELVQDKLGFQMNAPQRNIMRTIAELESAATDSGNVMVQAAPGAGKTSLIVVLNIMIEMMKTLGLIRDYPRILALAHMRQNRAMLERYLPPYVDKMTVHKLGWSLCQKMGSRYTVAEWKVPNITHAMLKKHYPMGVMLLDEDNSLNRRDNDELYWVLARFIKILITSLVDATNIAGIEWLYEQYTPDIAGITTTFRDAIIHKLAPEILQAIDANRKEGGYLSFEEQVVVPIRAKWFNHQYDIVLVDEGQDLSPAQQIIVERVAKYKFVVGDRNQAIMAFGGGDRAAWNRMSYILDATVLTMPISQRCPVKVVEYLQAVFKEVTPRENAPPGDVRILEDDETFVQYADKPGTGVICRTHADVAEAYVSLMHADVKTPIVILGSDVYGMVKQTVQGMGRIRSIPQPFTNENFQEYLNMWLQTELNKARQQRMQAQRDIKIADAKQAARTVSLLFNYFQPDTPQQLTELVGLRFGTSPDDIFHKQKLFKTSLVVGTCHMWKGLEIPHAIVYNTFNYGQERGAASQENEVLFVAMSRAQQTLAFYPEVPVKPVPVNYDVEYIAEQNNQIPYPGFDSSLFLRPINFEPSFDGLNLDIWKTALDEME